MNPVEVWFSLAERQAIHRGSYRSVKELNANIRAYIDGSNERRHPFIWTKPADQILKKANRKITSNAGRWLDDAAHTRASGRPLSASGSGQIGQLRTARTIPGRDPSKPPQP
jgi:hypothetical protein